MLQLVDIAELAMCYGTGLLPCQLCLVNLLVVYVKLSDLVCLCIREVVGTTAPGVWSMLSSCSVCVCTCMCL